MKKVLVAKYADNCYILVSGMLKYDDFGDSYVQPTMSFLYDAGEYAAEWEPRYGPIQVWHKCDKDAENAQEHYYYDYHNSSALNWSQLAVDQNNLPKALANCEFDYIFSVLRRWTRR
jgi:hypothetical protein